MFVFIVSVLLYLYLSVSLFACLYITILSVLPEWRINFIINFGVSRSLLKAMQSTDHIVYSLEVLRRTMHCRPCERIACLLVNFLLDHVFIYGPGLY